MTLKKLKKLETAKGILHQIKLADDCLRAVEAAPDPFHVLHSVTHYFPEHAEALTKAVRAVLLPKLQEIRALKQREFDEL